MRALACLLLLGGCGDLVGFGGPTAPLATLNVEVTGTPPADTDLRVALVWGTQWLPEPLCILPPPDASVAAVIAAGCRNPLSFTPDRVALSVAVAPNVPAQIELNQLPSADVMVGDVTARVAYASLVVFDDRDHDGTLTLGRSIRLPAQDMRGPDNEEPDTNDSKDVVIGASFVAMTEPDQRIAYREGGFNLTGYYPRRNCGSPAPGYSIVSAGGFTYDAAVQATLAGVLPEEDPASCAEEDIASLVEIPVRPTEEVAEVACEIRRTDSSIRYREPPQDSPDLSTHTYACTSIPAFGDDMSTAGITQLAVATAAGDQCKGLTHYTLVGCDEGVLVCDNFDWDIRATPPSWWPCDTGAP
ncbi:MAG TPA: hypothetical protein VGM90_41195 [Kofleriaceae bacterium]|jgi:hypothetical protein